MFGSNFFGNFGLPDFPYQGADPQGGYLGTNNPAGSTAPQTSIADPSPLGAGPLAPGTGQTPQQPAASAVPTAPAAGVGSPFGKPGV